MTLNAAPCWETSRHKRSVRAGVLFFAANYVAITHCLKITVFTNEAGMRQFHAQTTTLYGQYIAAIVETNH